MTRKLAVPFFMTLFCLAICIPILAHHGTAGVYDFGYRITTKATVTQYVWANPHVQIYFTLKNDKGEEETWGVETASPGNMLANGWTKNTFKSGDQLLVSFIPAKNDRHFGTCPQFVFVADGKRLGGNGRCGVGGGPGGASVDANALPVKPGYVAVEVQMPKDDRTRPESEQEQ
ncbi:MAG: hypothetical protein JO307_27125 [Bryobacterales bacterium]|nr:hypothetical protein [Bryobacterales bacterium]MBV9399357.1 hypothetical protein [Bryobacterales bacterium]